MGPAVSARGARLAGRGPAPHHHAATRRSSQWCCLCAETSFERARSLTSTTPAANFGHDKHQGANSSFLAVVKGGRWVRVTEPLSF